MGRILYEATRERLGNIEPLGWLSGVERGILCSHNGSNWWQRLLVELLEVESKVWGGSVVVIGRKPRSAPMTPADEHAGRFRFTSGSLSRVRDGLRHDAEDQHASGYA